MSIGLLEQFLRGKQTTLILATILDSSEPIQDLFICTP